MLYFHVFVIVSVRGWGGGSCIDWVIWAWCAVVQLESRVWGQRHNGRGIRGIRHGNIYGKGCLWASEHILCGFLQRFRGYWGVAAGHGVVGGVGGGGAQEREGAALPELPGFPPGSSAGPG